MGIIFKNIFLSRGFPVLRKSTLVAKKKEISIMKFNIDQDQVHIVDDTTDVVEFMHNIVESGLQEDDAFYVFDANEFIEKYKNWKEKLPRVDLYYAVKANDHAVMLRLLAYLGAGFDCTSKGEISKVLSVGVHPSRILFTNPTKPKSHIRYASDHNVDKVTFDNEIELQKIKALQPSAKLMLRIRCDANMTRIQLGKKFGCDPVTEAPRLLQRALDLDLNVVGVSFHVGCGCAELDAYRRAISASYRVTKLGQYLGFDIRLLDIGGGFPGNKDTSIDRLAGIINEALEEYFPIGCGTDIVAEPGRYFTSAFRLATMVHSKREVRHPKSEAIVSNMYYLNDGVYGSMNAVFNDRPFTFTPLPLTETRDREILPSSFWGPTADSQDVIDENIQFPNLNIGDWVMFENMGAYTFASATQFNGFPIPRVYTMLSESNMRVHFPQLKSYFDDK